MDHNTAKKTWSAPSVLPLAEVRDAEDRLLGLLSDGLLGTRTGS